MGLGGDPLALVTELPLFWVRNPDTTPGTPTEYLKLRDRFPEMKARLARDESIDDLMAPFDLHPVPIRSQMHLHLRALELGLHTVSDDLALI